MPTRTTFPSTTPHDRALSSADERTAPPFRFRWYGWLGLVAVAVGLVSAPFCGWTPQVSACVGGGAGLALAALLWACLRTCWRRR